MLIGPASPRCSGRLSTLIKSSLSKASRLLVRVGLSALDSKPCSFACSWPRVHCCLFTVSFSCCWLKVVHMNLRPFFDKISTDAFYQQFIVSFMPFCQLDGFRSDLMGQIMKVTMVRVCLESLSSIFPQKVMFQFPLTCFGTMSSL